MYVPVVTHIPACCPCSSRFFTISYFSQRGICNPDFPSKRTGLPCPASLDLTFFFFLLFVCLGSLAPLWQGPSFNHDQILPVHTCVWTSNALLSLGPQSANASFLSLPTCCWRRRGRPAIPWASSSHQGPISCFTRRKTQVRGAAHERYSREQTLLGSREQGPCCAVYFLSGKKATWWCFQRFPVVPLRSESQAICSHFSIKCPTGMIHCNSHCSYCLSQ